MIQSIPAKNVRTGMSLVLGQLLYKVTHTEPKDEGKIQFHLYRHKIRSALVTKLNDELTVES